MRAKILVAGLMALIPSLTLANATPPPILATGLCASGGEEIAAKIDAAPVKAALMSGYGVTRWKIATASPGLLRQRPEPGPRLRPQAGDRRFRRSRAARSDLRHVPVGPGLVGRPDHQLHDRRQGPG
jgi:hypothetical protein